MVARRGLALRIKSHDFSVAGREMTASLYCGSEAENMSPPNVVFSADVLRNGRRPIICAPQPDHRLSGAAK